ncbi:MAG: hypothetical protein OXF62_07725 [Caldilineaceae bacterium]|nr:hypothetical protein [Caldilineaceae bacterium]
MSGFKKDSHGVAGWLGWEGDPDDDTAHKTILNWLRDVATTGFLGSAESLSNAVKGNLGEFIAYRLGSSYVFTNNTIANGANTWDPLSRISRPDIDIVWLHIGDSKSDDWAAIQEVKTTGEASLRLAEDLNKDYDKLFGENVRLTIQTRLGALKNELEQQGQRDLGPRVTALGGPSPSFANGIRLIPTLVHDAEHTSTTKMTAIRQVLIGQGWSSDVVECWSVALSDLDSRLARLARGQL